MEISSTAIKYPTKFYVGNLTKTWKSKLRAKTMQRNGAIIYIDNIFHFKKVKDKPNIYTRKLTNRTDESFRLTRRINVDWKNKPTNINKHRKIVSDKIMKVLTLINN